LNVTSRHGGQTTCRGVGDDMRVAALRLTSSFTQVDCLCKCYIKTWGQTTCRGVDDELLQDSRVRLNVTSRHGGQTTCRGVGDDLILAASRLTSSIECYIKTWGANIMSRCGR
jgi:predicted small secreted protein